MEIVTQWAWPLKEVLLKKLEQTALSVEDIEKLRRDIALLDGAIATDDLHASLEKKIQELDNRYEAALRKIANAKSASAADEGIHMLQTLGDYRSAKDELTKAEKRRAMLKKRPALIAVGVAASLVLIIACVIIRGNILANRLTKEIAQLQFVAENGQIAEAEEGLAAVLGKAEIMKRPEHYQQLQPVIEAILENTADEKGFAAAYARYDTLKEESESILKPNEFWQYSVGKLQSDELSAVDRWELLRLVEQHKASGLSYEKKQELLNDCIASLSEKLEQGASSDMKAWAEANYAAMDDYMADPDLALRFLYALHRAGFDVYELFPEGIRLDLPMAGEIEEQLKLLMDNTEAELPDISTLLPVSICEDSNYKGKSIIKSLSSTSDDDLREMRRDDTRYEVRLLTEYLFSLREDLLPESFSSCTSLLCMEMLYFSKGTISSQTTYMSGYSYRSSSTDYHPFFSALDIIAVADMKVKDRLGFLYVQENNAKVEDDEWFKANKSDTYLVLNRENMLGNFDEPALKEAYKLMIDSPDLLELLLYMS